MTTGTTIGMLSDHFSFEEGIVSDTAARIGINNIPDHDTLLVMYKTATKMEKVRTLFDKPIHINSWFRCQALNRIIGSKDTSQHIKGEAVDFIIPTYGSCLEVCRKIIANADLIGFDQLILEHTWVHISFSILNRAPRGQVLSLLANGSYAQGLTDVHGRTL